MGRKCKKRYDIFDQIIPVTHVQLPRLDPRQPGQRSSLTKDGSLWSPSFNNLNEEDSINASGRNNPSSTRTRSGLTESNCPKNIRVKIPTFTNPVVTKEHLTLASTSATASKHRKHQSHEDTGLSRASSKKHASSPLAPRLTTRAITPHRHKQRDSAKQNITFRAGRTTKTEATVSTRPIAVAHSNPATGPSQFQGSTGKCKAAAKATTMKAARAHYREEKLANEKARRHGANKGTTSLTSARADLVAASSAVTGPKTKALPAVTASKPKLKSSPKQWTDYASHTSAGHHLEASHKPHFRNPRGGSMSHQPSSPYNRTRGAHQRQYGGPIARHHNDWTSWVEVRVYIYGLTPNIGTRELGRSFKDEGSITVIELFEDSSGSRNGKARIIFSPPPSNAFWLRENYPVDSGVGVCYVQMELDLQRRTFKAPSPVDSNRKYQELMVLNADSVDFGIMHNPTTMMSMFTAFASSHKPIQFRQSMLYREIVIELELALIDSRPPGTHPKAGKHDRAETIRFSIPFRQLEVIHQVQVDRNRVVLLMSLDQPPRFFRKVDELGTHEDNGRYWTQNDAWFRQTDIVYDPKSLRSSPLTLKKTKPVIDIGRWTTYRFSFDMSRNDRRLFDEMCQALKDHNVRFCPFPNFKLIKDQEPAVWDFIDKPTVVETKPKNSLEELLEDVEPRLIFPVRYQLEVCISQGLLNEHNLTQEFVDRLLKMDATKAQDVLEYVANQKKRIYDPMTIFSVNVIKGSASRRKIPQYCMYSRSATVTPSTVYYNTPTVDTSNRIIRQYAEYADRFLRIRFTDEKSQGRINWTDKQTMDEVFTRVKRTMKNGITIGDRHYEFLAFGNSQFREHGAYFFSPLPHLNANQIRQWMGLFSDIKTIAKYAARLGQCFSTTRAINCTKVTIKEMDDIKRNGHTFTDGVGKISPFLAQLVAGELGLTLPEAPSVFQFRLGGCKGVLAVWPDVKFREIHIRESQYKFPAKHEGLEIIRWSQMASSNLNRQLISVLSSRGVDNDVFVRKLQMQLASLEQAMTDERAALTLLQKDIDHNQMTMALAGMILDGFHKTKEPFLDALLHLWRAWSIKYLKEKARINISSGAQLLGCIDETATLKGHYDKLKPDEKNTRQEKEAMLPEVFIQLSKGPDNKPYVVCGLMLLARNPSLYPADIRVVRGVDIPGLRHLKDVVVLPQTGDRDISSMCSGGDLDGDDYVVMWDQDLIPPESQWFIDPVDYTPPDPLKVERDVTTDDITSFFVTYIKNDSLRSIANAHLAQADYLDDGVKDEKCLRLAALHSMAVDYVKTGVPARMTRDLRPRKWPHFMEKNHKPKDQIYESKKILGQLYDQVERVAFEPKSDGKYDERILHAYTLDSLILQQAADLKYEYDAAIRRIMAQHEIGTEYEVWTTFVLQHSNPNDYKFHEEIGRLSQTLKDDFRTQCYRKAGGKDFEFLAPFVAAMYHVTNEERQLALRECDQMVTVAGVDTPLRKQEASSMPLTSFPWLFPSILGRIANGEINSASEDLTVNVQDEHKRPMPKQKVLPTNEEDLLLETAEGITHRGENLVLFENIDGSDTGFDKEQSTLKRTSASNCSSRGRITASCGELDLVSLLNDETPEVGPGKCAAQDSSSNPTPSSSVSADSIVNDNGTLGPSAADLDEPFRSEKAKVGTLEDGGTRKDSQWDGSDESDGDEELIEIHVDNKGSYLERLNKLIGS